MTGKRATSFDVAKAAGVSRTTVSFVLNNVDGVSISETTRKRVRETANQLNYYPDATGRKLVSGKSYAIGLVLRQSSEQVFADTLLPQVILGVEHAASQKNFHVLLKPLEPEDNDGYQNLIHENHVDGILLSGPRKDDIEIVKLYGTGTPIMLMGQLPKSGIPYVDMDTQKGATLAVDHLIGLGHKRISLITNAALEYTSAEQRLAGYQMALESAGLTYEASLVKAGNYTPASGFAAMQSLLKCNPLPTAVFVASDVVALGAMLAIKQAGLRIPHDIAVVGFDDIPLSSYFDPPLTTIHLPAYGLGWAAGDRLVRLIRGEGLDHNSVLLEPELIIRSSSK